jgi:hypothetical protein
MDFLHDQADKLIVASRNSSRPVLVHEHPCNNDDDSHDDQTEAQTPRVISVVPQRCACSSQFSLPYVPRNLG